MSQPHKFVLFRVLTYDHNEIGDESAKIEDYDANLCKEKESLILGINLIHDRF